MKLATTTGDFQAYTRDQADAMLCPVYGKRAYDKDTRLLLPPMEIKEKAERLLYDIGKHILTAYDCFEG